MKRFLSIVLCAMMLAGLFAINVNAAIPTKTGSLELGTPIIYQDYEDDAVTYFTTIRGTTSITGEPFDETATNKAFSLKLEDPTIDAETGEVTAIGAYHRQLTQGVANSDALTGTAAAPEITLPSKYVIQFDFYAVDNSGHLAITSRGASKKIVAVKLDPNHFDTGKWYTCRIYVDRQNGNTEITSSNVTKAVQDSSMVYLKEKASTGDFEGMYYATAYDTTGMYFKNGEYIVDNSTVSNGCVNFVIASRYKPYNSAVDKDNIFTPSGATSKDYIDALGTEYYIDNIGIYNWPTKTSYEIKEGLTLDVDVDTGAERFSAQSNVKNHYWLESNGNAVLEMAYNDTLTTAANSNVKVEAELPEEFVFYADACNTDLGLPIAFEFYTSTSKRTVCIISKADIEDTWYTYKVYEKNEDGTISLSSVYRKPKGSNEAYTLLTAGTDYALAQGLSSLTEFEGMTCAYHAGLASQSYFPENADALDSRWLLDNFQIAANAAVSGEVSKADSTITAALNVETASDSAVAVVGVYDGTTLMDVQYANLSTGEGLASITVNTDWANYTSPSAKVYVWDSLSTGKPLMIDVLDITNNL